MTQDQLATHSMSAAELRREYDALAGEYDRKLWFDQAILGVGRLRKRLMSKAHGRILDVACGTGLNFPFFPPTSDVTGIDLSPKMLENANQTAEQLGLKAELMTMDAEDLKFADQSFDTVVSSLSTCTFPDPVKALREMGRVVHHNGQILLLEHGHSRIQWVARMQDRGAVQHVHENAGCRWNQEPLDLVQEAGLRIVSSNRSVLGIFHSIVAEA